MFSLLLQTRLGILVFVPLVNILAVVVLVLILVVSVQPNETLLFFFLFELFRVGLLLMEFKFPH